MSALRRAEDLVGVLLFGALIVVVFIQVVVRYLLHQWIQIAWADEVGRALLVWVCFWGAVLVHREDGHVVIPILYDACPPRVRLVLRVLSQLTTAVFLLVIVWKGVPIALDSLTRRTAASGLPRAIFDGPLWLGTCLMLLHSVRDVSGTRRRAREAEGRS